MERKKEGLHIQRLRRVLLASKKPFLASLSGRLSLSHTSLLVQCSGSGPMRSFPVERFTCVPVLSADRVGTLSSASGIERTGLNAALRLHRLHPVKKDDGVEVAATSHLRFLVRPRPQPWHGCRIRALRHKPFSAKPMSCSDRASLPPVPIVTIGPRKPSRSLHYRPRRRRREGHFIESRHSRTAIGSPSRLQAHRARLSGSLLACRVLQRESYGPGCPRGLGPAGLRGTSQPLQRPRRGRSTPTGSSLWSPRGPDTPFLSERGHRERAK
jgi:hypothetical protein